MKAYGWAIRRYSSCLPRKGWFEHLPCWFVAKKDRGNMVHGGLVARSVREVWQLFEELSDHDSLVIDNCKSPTSSAIYFPVLPNVKARSQCPRRCYIDLIQREDDIISASQERDGFYAENWPIIYRLLFIRLSRDLLEASNSQVLILQGILLR